MVCRCLVLITLPMGKKYREYKEKYFCETQSTGNKNRCGNLCYFMKMYLSW